MPVIDKSRIAWGLYKDNQDANEIEKCVAEIVIWLPEINTYTGQAATYRIGYRNTATALSYCPSLTST